MAAGARSALTTSSSECLRRRKKPKPSIGAGGEGVRLSQSPPPPASYTEQRHLRNLSPSDMAQVKKQLPSIYREFFFIMVPPTPMHTQVTSPAP